MAQNIKGITVEFAGDTTKLDKALRKIKDEAKGIDKELREVNNALKFNPKNADLLAQKQTLLRQKVEQTEKSLRDLKNVQEQMDQQGVDKTSEEYRKVQREIVQTESKLKHYTAELKRANLEANKVYRLGGAFKDAGAKIESAGQKLRGVSAAAAAVTAALAGMAYKAGVAADDLNTLSKITGISTRDLQMYAAMADLVDVSVEDMARGQQRLKKSMLTASEGGSTAKYFEELGVAVTNSDGSLRNSQEVFEDTIVALGKMDDETRRDAISMALMGKSATNLNPLIEDQGETYKKVSKLMKQYGLEPVSQKDLDRANKFNDAIDTMKLVFLQTVQIAGSKIAGYLAPMMDKLVKKISKVAKWFTSLSGETLSKIMAIMGVIALLSPALILLGKIINTVGTAIQTATKIVQGLSTAISFLAANPIVLVIAGITALVAAFVILWKKSEAFRNFWIGLWTTMKTTAQNAINAVTGFFSNAWAKIKAIFGGWSAFWSGLGNALRNKFVNIGTALGNAVSGAIKGGVNKVIARVESIINSAIALINSAITLANKLPGVNVGKVNALHLPRLAEGGVLRHAQAVIAGEAGPEAIIPLDKLFRQMDKMAATINGGTVINVYGAAGQSVNELAAEIERRLIESQKRRSAAWA